MRAATTLVPSLQATAGVATVPHVWRGDQWISPDPRGQYATSGYAALDAELPGHGWPRGQLVELLTDHPGIGELSLLLPSLAEASRHAGTCVWVLPVATGAAGRADAPTDGARAHALPYAPALEAAGLDLAHNIFVRPHTVRESGWALEQSLRAAHLGALVGWLPEGSSGDADFRSLRRLHLLAQRHRALVFILRSARHAASPSPAGLRLRLLQHEGLLHVHLIKRRGRPLMEPVQVQVYPGHWNRAPAPAPVPPAAVLAKGFAAASASLIQMVQAMAGNGSRAIPAAR